MKSSYVTGSLFGLCASMATLLATLSATVGAQAALASMPDPGVYLNSNGSPLLPLLQSANRTIDIEIYTMNDPTVHQLIRQALSRGVKVRVLKDPNPLESNCDTFLPLGQSGKPSDSSAACMDERKLVQDVRNAGGTFQEFDKSNLCPNGGKSSWGGEAGSGCYEHGKIAIADGSVAMISTGNFDDTNLCIASENPARCNRDYSVIENDSTLVNTLENIFNTDLAGNAYDVRTLIPSSLTGILTVSPYSLQPLLDFINSARSSIDVETQYLKDNEINAALVDASKRGVKVNVTVASICAFGKPSSSEIKSTTTTYSAFDSAGISTAMFNTSNTINGRPGYLHAKAIIVDGNRAWVGSENGSTESLTENREYGIIFDDGSWIQFLSGIVDSDHNSPESETWNQSLNCEKDSGALGVRAPDEPNNDGKDDNNNNGGDEATKHRKKKNPPSEDPAPVVKPEPSRPEPSKPEPVKPEEPPRHKKKKPTPAESQD